MNVLDTSTVDPNPIEQFKEWFSYAGEKGVYLPESMTLATVSNEGFPSARVVLLKDVDERGFTFFTNYTSRKGTELNATPRAALVLHWHILERQVRIEGTVERISAEESDRYFQTRPRISRIGAAISPQSQPIESREELERLFEEASAKYEGKEIPRPEHWGGYRVSPERIEFWQGREGRLHDRIEYRLLESGVWLIHRLAP